MVQQEPLHSKELSSGPYLWKTIQVFSLEITNVISAKRKKKLANILLEAIWHQGGGQLLLTPSRFWVATLERRQRQRGNPELGEGQGSEGTQAFGLAPGT